MLAMVLLLFVIIWYVDYTVLKPQVGVMLSSLLGPPDPNKTQLIEDPETGERKAKMTEVQCKSARKGSFILWSSKEQAVLAREIRRRGKNKVWLSKRSLIMTIKWSPTSASYALHCKFSERGSRLPKEGQWQNRWDLRNIFIQDVAWEVINASQLQPSWRRT